MDLRLRRMLDDVLLQLWHDLFHHWDLLFFDCVFEVLFDSVFDCLCALIMEAFALLLGLEIVHRCEPFGSFVVGIHVAMCACEGRFGRW
jgi:hypothetical protein